MARRPSQRGRNGPADDFTARVAELYAGPPAEFTAARGALARRLADAGDPDAARIARLRRPTVALWLLNATARRSGAEVEALLAAGDRLRRAQVRALHGNAQELRDAGAAMRDAIAALLAAARAAAREQGRDASASLLGELEAALRAVALADGEVRDTLRAGALQELPRLRGDGALDLLSGLTAVPPPAPSARSAGTPSATSARRRGESRTAPAPARVSGSVASAAPEQNRAAPSARQRRAEEHARAAEERARAAAEKRRRERALADAERQARVVRRAEERLARADRALADAQRVADEARREVEAARSAAERLHAVARGEAQT